MTQLTPINQSMHNHPTNPDIVLIVDDVPENLSLLHDALDEAGYTVLVATNGESALQRANHSRPDVMLLDALMPGMDGFEVARRMKADFVTQHIPIIFMTGLTETEHVVAAFSAGGADYVTKPIKPQEVLVRIAAHMQNARQMKQARTALDAFGQATAAIRASDGRLVWQTPLARKLLRDYFIIEHDQAPPQLLSWILEAQQAALEHRKPPVLVATEASRLLASLHDASHLGHEGEWLLVLREEIHASSVEALMAAFRLTNREAEVLYWLIYGKTNRDIGDILGISHRTINKHLENLFEKLGVETRTAAAALAMRRLQLPAQA